MPIKGADMSSMVIELIEDAGTALLERGLSALHPVLVHKDFRWITSTGEVPDAEQARWLIDPHTRRGPSRPAAGPGRRRRDLRVPRTRRGADPAGLGMGAGGAVAVAAVPVPGDTDRGGHVCLSNMSVGILSVPNGNLGRIVRTGRTSCR